MSQDDEEISRGNHKKYFSFVSSPTKPERDLSIKSQQRDDWNVNDFRLDSYIEVGFGEISVSLLDKGEKLGS